MTDRPSFRSFLFVTGPGHGAPSALAVLYLEGAITHFYPQYAGNREGLKKVRSQPLRLHSHTKRSLTPHSRLSPQLIRAFSFPGGFPSHVNAETPGAIHEGGELGYALAVSFGAVSKSKVSPHISNKEHF